MIQVISRQSGQGTTEYGQQVKVRSGVTCLTSSDRSREVRQAVGVRSGEVGQAVGFRSEEVGQAIGIRSGKVGQATFKLISKTQDPCHSLPNVIAFSTNARCLNFKRSELTANGLSEKPDVLSVTDTWGNTANNHHLSAELATKGRKVSSKDRFQKAGGEVMFYVNGNLNVIQFT